MIAPLAKFLDWSLINALSLRMPRDGDTRLEEALRYLKGPYFLPADRAPAKVEFTRDASEGRFRFPTPQPCEFAANNVVHGRLYRATPRWQEQPAIVLLHGTMDFPNHRLLFPRIARRCNRAGFSAATMELPYHFQRRSNEPPGVDYLRWAKSMAQAVAEIRALAGWFLQEGCPAVALWGVSLGAWLAGMTVCHESRLAAVVMTASPGRLTNLLYGVEFEVRRRSRELSLARRPAFEALDPTEVSPIYSRPMIAKESILLIEGIYDLCVSSGPHELWQAWGQPEIWRLPHGHIGTGSQLIPGLRDRILRWLAPRLTRSIQ